jgi:hypothetical protein
MPDITSTCVFTGTKPELNYREVIIETPNSADAADTLTLTLPNYGIGKLLYVEGYKHTTDYSVIEREDPTTSVTSGVLTMTIPAGTDDDIRVYIVVGRPLV